MHPLHQIQSSLLSRPRWPSSLIGRGRLLLFALFQPFVSSLAQGNSEKDPENSHYSNETARVDAAHERLSHVVADTFTGLDVGLNYLISGDREKRKYFPYPPGTEAPEKDQDDLASGVLRIAPRIEFSRFDDPDPGIDFSARIELPRTRERLQLIVDSIDREDLPVEALDRFRPREDPDREDDTSVFLRLRALHHLLFHLDWDVGMSFRPEPTPRTRLRAQRAFDHDPWHYVLRQDGFWRSDDGFGERSSLEIRRMLDASSFIRSNSAVLWSETSRGAEPGQILGYYRAFENNHETVGLEGGFFAVSHPNLQMDRYIVRVPYRRQIWRPWFFFRIEPAVDFARENNFKYNPRIVFQIEAFFGHPGGEWIR